MQNNTARGIAFLCLGVLVFSLQDAIIKQVSGAYPLTEVVFVRSLVGLPIFLVLVHREVGFRALFASQLGFLALRALILFVSYTAYYMAFPALPLADAVALYFTVPLFVTALAGPFLGERTHWRVWLAVLLGFAGVMRPISTSCVDHMGSNWARVHTWDGKQWNFTSDWLQADEQILKPLVKSTAAKYAAEKKMEARTVADCQS